MIAAAKSNSPPCPCKELRDKDGAAAGFEILFGKDGHADRSAYSC